MAIQLFSLRAFWRRRTRLEKAFLLLSSVWLVNLTAIRLIGITLPLSGLPNFLFLVLAVILGFIYLRRFIRHLLWRLRNRLIVTYIFIGVVPMTLLLAMLGISMYVLMGQVATYLVTTELKRRNELVSDFASGLALNVSDHMRSGAPEPAANEFLNVFRGRHPHLQAVVRASGKTFSVPADAGVKVIPEWSEPASSGLVSAGLNYALAAYNQGSQSKGDVDVFAYEPVDSELLAGLLPGLATVQFLELENTSGGGKRLVRQRGESDPDTFLRLGDQSYRLPGASQFARLPDAKAWWDIIVSWGTPVPVRKWEMEGSDILAVVVVRSRPSLIIDRLFSISEEWASALKLALIAIGVLFLGVEVVSLMMGVGLTRTITRSVADLYKATRMIKVGDFSPRIPIRANDQLSELASSFNSMTENIQKLILESKERERLESELEIAREVQQQLFPKNVPRLKTLELAGVCTPARMVSGDYYDFVPLDSGWTALALGDIAGKGISAALLMASIQSSLRAQLDLRKNSRRLASNGDAPIYTSHLVTLLNRQLYESTSPEKFASFYCAVYDENTSKLFYTNAGHLPPILIRQGKASRLEISGMVLGVLPDNFYEQNCLELKPGDLLVAFTDGITEPENEYGEEYGESRLTDLLLLNARKPLDELVTAVTRAVSEWSNSPEQQDDMTLLVARRF